MSAQEPCQIFQSFIGEWAGGVEAVKRSFANYLAEDVRYENVGATLVTNRTEACELIEHFASGLDSVGVDMLAIAQDGDRVFTERVDYLYRSDGSIIKIFRIMGIFVVRAGKISEWRDYFHLVETDRKSTRLNSSH